MPLDKQLPTWLKTGTKPPDNILNTDGWKPGDKPPADWLNWFFNTVFLNLQELQQEAAEKALVYTKTEVDTLDDQAEANVMNWVKAFGLGGYGKQINDANDANESGFYILVGDLLNGPQGEWYYLINTAYDSVNKSQIAIGVNTGNVWTRKQQGTWSAWQQLETTAGAQAKIEQTEYKTYKTVKDANGVYTTIEKKRNDGTLAIKSVLSGGTSPQYTTRTITYYATDGTTVAKTTTRALSYDTDGDLLNEV